ncbi:hypothetical protein D3C76_1585560 [compost metagenome]
METPIPNSSTASPPARIREAAKGRDRKAEVVPLAESQAAFFATDILVFLSTN